MENPRTSKLTNNGENSTWTLVRGKSKSPSSTRKVNKPEGKPYKSALRLDSTWTGSKRLKTPSPRYDGTISIKNLITTVHVMQELIDRYFAPIFKLIKGVVTSTKNNAKQLVDTGSKNIFLNIERDLAETLNRA